MREILFRGKSKITNEWVIGDLLVYAGNTEIWSDSELGKFAASVIPETVGQFTGLTDKNGKKIFEWDIVTGSAYSQEWIGVIVWIDEIASFGVRYRHRSDPTTWEKSSILKRTSKGFTDEFAAEVIGNVHDNPKLIGGAENG